jgi:flavorubredoxin
MSSSILVAYATQHGSTQEVAEAVAATLRERRFAVDTQPAREASTASQHAIAVVEHTSSCLPLSGSAEQGIRSMSASRTRLV